jgi:hypothetical protein
MNLREGTRRLALVLGVVGAILCGVLSYAQLQSTLSERADHQKFEKLANSPTAVQAHKEVRMPGPWDKYDALAFKAGGTFGTDVNDGGIKKIFWNRKYRIASLETEDGRTLYPTPAPGLWSYVLIGILPLLGFLIPWGVVRSLGWVVTGFLQQTN